LCPFNIFPNLALERLQGWEDPLAAEFFQERDFYGFAVQVAAQAEEMQFQHVIQTTDDGRRTTEDGRRTTAIFNPQSAIRNPQLSAAWST